jgi:hypothetical protein
MNDLKQGLSFHLKKWHLGRINAVTVHDLIIELSPIQANDREIRETIRQLNLDGVPILTSVHSPYGIYFASCENEMDEYLANLGARARAIHERMGALSKIKAREFLRGQLRLFE